MADTWDRVSSDTSLAGYEEDADATGKLRLFILPWSPEPKCDAGDEFRASGRVEPLLP